MTTLYKDKTECPNCNDEVEYTDLMSTNSMGYPDLDLRPPPMQRDTLHTYIKVCHSCGCRFAKIYPKELFRDEIIKSPEYLKILHDKKTPSLAKDFLAYAIYALRVKILRKPMNSSFMLLGFAMTIILNQKLLSVGNKPI